MPAPVAHDGYGRVAKRLARWAMWLIGLFALCALPQVFVVLMGHGDQKSDFARLDLARLGVACEAFHQKNGSWPEEARWAEQLVGAQMLKGAPLDPWHRPYQYSLTSTDGGGLVPRFMSLGRDGLAGTEDDVQ